MGKNCRSLCLISQIFRLQGIPYPGDDIIRDLAEILRRDSLRWKTLLQDIRFCTNSARENVWSYVSEGQEIPCKEDDEQRTHHKIEEKQGNTYMCLSLPIDFGFNGGPRQTTIAIPRFRKKTINPWEAMMQIADKKKPLCVIDVVNTLRSFKNPEVMQLSSWTENEELCIYMGENDIKNHDLLNRLVIAGFVDEGPLHKDEEIMRNEMIKRIHKHDNEKIYNYIEAVMKRGNKLMFHCVTSDQLGECRLPRRPGGNREYITEHY